jgi:predicted DNA-binding transcriptional regulator AlpA
MHNLEVSLPPDVFLRPREVAARTGLALATLAALRCRGQGPAYRKVNRAVFYRWGDVIAWMGNARQSTSDAPPAPRAA